MHEQRCFLGGDLRALRCSKCSERAPAPAPQSWPAAPPRPAAWPRSPGSRPGPPHHTLALDQAAWQAALWHKRSQRARVCTWALSRASTSVSCTVSARRSASARNCSSTCLSCAEARRSAQPLPSRRSRAEGRVRWAAPRLVVQVPPHALQRPSIGTLRVRSRLWRRHSWWTGARIKATLLALRAARAAGKQPSRSRLVEADLP